MQTFKKYLIIIVGIGIVSLSLFSAHSEVYATQEISINDSNQGISIEPYSTATYFFWRQRSATFVRNQTVGDWRNLPVITIAQNNQTNCQTVSYSQTTVGVSLSIGPIVAGGISVTPGGSRTITSTTCSAPLARGTYRPQYRRMESVYTVVQERWLHDVGRDTFVGPTQTGTVRFGTTPSFRWVRQ